MTVYPIRWDKKGYPTLYASEVVKLYGKVVSQLPYYGKTACSVISQALGNAYLATKLAKQDKERETEIMSYFLAG